MPNQNVDQRRAKHAWDRVQYVIEKLPDAKKEYGGAAKKLPVRILTSGLGPALAFVNAKAGKPGASGHKKGIAQLLLDLDEWVLRKRPIKGKGDTLLESIVKDSSDFLRRTTDETLAYLQWLNRFAEAEGLTDDE